MKGFLIVLIAGSIATAQTPEAQPSESYTPAEIARAFKQCGNYLEQVTEDARRFPTPRFKGLPYDDVQSSADWLQACVLSELQGNRVEFQLLG